MTLLKDQIQGICIACKINKQARDLNSKLGFKRYIKYCRTCQCLRYGMIRDKEYKKYKKYKKDKCEKCDFKGDPIQLDVHHKDHNRKNNSPDNLQTLCANCHRLKHKPKRKLIKRKVTKL
jgi:5-methylcytosine-specific restriction endonuclease McrA